MDTRLQQVLVDVPISRLKDGESARSYIHSLVSRLGIAGTDLQQQFHQLLSQVFTSALGFWICDYVAIVCADASIISSDPEEHTVLQPSGVLGWCQGAAQELQHRVVTIVKSSATSEAHPDQAIDVYHAAKTLLAIAKAVQAALGNRSQAAADLTAKLHLLQQTTQVLQWLEQLQQQRPGQPPLITRTITSAHSPISTGLPGLNPTAAAPIEPFGPRTAPSYVSLPAWQQQLKQLRQRHPNGRLFLDDLIDGLLRVSEGQRTVEYPYKDVLGCVEGLFMSGNSSRDAWRAKLSVLQYYLLDGGWLTAAAPLAQGFHLPLTMVQQWQCHYLMDNASSSTSSTTGSSYSAAEKLDEACRLLGAIASPATPFRFVEALLAAGRPTTALAVQRARCAAGGSAVTSLSEAQVLLKVQLGCGLLAEAFSELRKHCSQLSKPQRFTQVKVLMQQLAAWATAHGQQQQQQEPAVSSRVQQLCQLPLNAEEEAALLGYFRERMAAGQSGGGVVPLYLLQRGRSLEALKAYADYRASPAAAAAANSEQGALLHRQLQTLMSAAAAALPPSLRASAVSTNAASSSDGAAAVSILSGLGGLDLGESKSSTPVAVLSSQGVEQPVFMSQVVPAAVAGDAGVRWQAVAAGGETFATQDTDQKQDSVTATSAATSSWLNTTAAKAGPCYGVAKAADPVSERPIGSLFAAEIAAAAGPGSVALGSSHQGESTDPYYVPLLFGTPAPAGAAAQKTGQPLMGLEQSGFSTPGVSQGLGFGMSEEEFGREVLGLGQGFESARKAAAGGSVGVDGYVGSVRKSTKRSSKRARQTPGGFVE